MIDRLWDKSKPPKGPFTLHKDSPSAYGLVRAFLLGKNTNKNGMWGFSDSSSLVNLIFPSAAINLGLSTASGAQSLIFDGSSGYCSMSNSDITAAPISYGAKITPRVVSGNYGLICNGNFATSGSPNAARHQFDINNGVVRMICTGNSTTGSATISGITAQNEHSVLGVVGGTASRIAYLNGIAGTTETTSVPTYSAAFDTLAAGAIFLTSTYQAYYDGSMSEICVWNHALPNEKAIFYTDPGNRYELWYPLRSNKWFSFPASNDLTGASVASSVATGDIKSSLALIGANISLGDATGAIAMSTSLSGASASASIANGDVSIAMELSGASVASAIAMAQASMAQSLSGDAVVSSVATGAITMSVAISGASISQALASAGIAISMPLSGSTQSGAIGIGDLTSIAGGELIGNAQGQVNASGQITIDTPLSGSASAYSSGTGSMAAIIPVQGVSASISTATGNLTLDFAFDLSGNAVAQSLVNGNLYITVPLSGASISSAIAYGALTDSAMVAVVGTERIYLIMPSNKITLSRAGNKLYLGQ